MLEVVKEMRRVMTTITVRVISLRVKATCSGGSDERAPDAWPLLYATFSLGAHIVSP